jgi:hypothetical protein
MVFAAFPDFPVAFMQKLRYHSGGTVWDYHPLPFSPIHQLIGNRHLFLFNSSDNYHITTLFYNASDFIAKKFAVPVIHLFFHANAIY